MRLKLGSFSRYRPRALTVLVFFAIAAPIAMANLTYDQALHGIFFLKSFGWPLVWHRFVSVLSTEPHGEIGWYYSLPRLAANLAMWLAMLIAPAAACEWLVRRYRLRLRWSLRTMLVAIGVTAAFFAWFVAARERANLQDPLIAAINGRAGYVSLDRWGPKWLSLVGADRYRRQLIFACVRVEADNDEDVRLLNRLGRLLKMRHLKVEVDCLTSEIANAMSRLRQLRSLSIRESDEDGDHGERTWHESLAAIDKMAQLEYLHMELPITRCKQLAQLDGLTNLKSLRVDGSFVHGDEATSHECLQAIGHISQLEFLELGWMKIRAESLACLDGSVNLKQLSLWFVHARESSLLERLPLLPRLGVIDVVNSDVGDRDLRRLAFLPYLRSLGLDVKGVTPAGLREFMARSSIEELALKDELASADALESLLASKRLKSLHLDHNEFGPFAQWDRLVVAQGEDVKALGQEFNRCLEALQTLRQSHPGIVIDGETSAISEEWQNRSASSYDSDPDSWHDSNWLPAPSMAWMTPTERAAFEKSKGWARFDGAGFRDEYGRTFTASF